MVAWVHLLKPNFDHGRNQQGFCVLGPYIGIRMAKYQRGMGQNSRAWDGESSKSPVLAKVILEIIPLWCNINFGWMNPVDELTSITFKNISNNALSCNIPTWPIPTWPIHWSIDPHLGPGSNQLRRVLLAVLLKAFSVQSFRHLVIYRCWLKRFVLNTFQYRWYVYIYICNYVHIFYMNIWICEQVFQASGPVTKKPIIQSESAWKSTGDTSGTSDQNPLSYINACRQTK